MLVRLIVLFAVTAIVAVGAAWWRRREGRFSEATGRFQRAELGIARGITPGAVLVEFYGVDCAPCVVVQKRIDKLTEEIPGVEVVQIDAGERLDLSDRYNVRRVPTLFVTDGDLRIIWRASGVPSEDAIRQALLGPEWSGRPAPESADQKAL